MRYLYNSISGVIGQEFETQPDFECWEATPELELEISQKIKAIIVNGVVTEGASAEEVNTQKTIIFTKRITDAFTHLRRRALASSINKPLSLGWDYITEQADQYRYKYKVATGQVQDAVVNQMIDDEAQDFGINPTQMRGLIVQMFEEGEARYTAFTAMIERGRTKALTAVENSDWTKAEILTVMLESVPEQLTMEQAQQLTTNLLNV